MLDRNVVEGVDQVSDMYNSFNNNEGTWSVWFGEGKKFFQPPPNITEFEDRQALLISTLESLARSGDSTKYYLRVHGAVKGIISNKEPYTIVIPFRLNKLPDEAKQLGMYNGMPTGFGGLLEKLNGIPDQIKAHHDAIEERLSALENDEPVEPDGIKGMLSGMLQNEQVVSAIGAVIGQTLQKILSNILPQQQPMTQSLNGFPTPASQNNAVSANEIDMQLLDNTLSRLSKHFDLNTDLVRMADYLDRNPDKVEFVKSFLR